MVAGFGNCALVLHFLQRDFAIEPAMGEDGIVGGVAVEELLYEEGFGIYEAHVSFL